MYSKLFQFQNSKLSGKSSVKLENWCDHYSSVLNFKIVSHQPCLYIFSFCLCCLFFSFLVLTLLPWCLPPDVYDLPGWCDWTGGHEEKFQWCYDASWCTRDGPLCGYYQYTKGISSFFVRNKEYAQRLNMDSIISV